MNDAASREPLSSKQAISYSLGAIASFHLAYTFAPCSFLIAVYLFCLFRLANLGTSRKAFYIGLAIGMAACLLLFVIVRFEWSFDSFQSKYSRIYRVVTQDKYPDGITYNAGIPGTAPDALRMDFPETTASYYLI